jgi:hypothetical protein
MAVGHKAFAQKKPDQLVYLELGSGNGGMLLSISEEGFRFRAVSPVRPQSLLPFAFSLDGSHRLEGTGEVEWLEDDGKSGGMRFLEVSSEFRSLLGRWLGADARSPGGREVVPAAATPLDTMDKIREEIRRGYPAASKSEGPARGPAEGALHGEPGRKRVLEEPGADPPANRPRADKDRRGTNRFLPPPEPATPASLTSAFLKPASEAAEPSFPAVPPAAPAPRPARPRPAEPRPYVPPPEESFEQAWERAQLTAPPESPHLSRAAAGSIIGIALAVILGALAFNFRQDIGAAVIDLGRKISGKERPASSPAPAAAPEEPKPQPQSSGGQESVQKSEPAVTGDAGVETGKPPATAPSAPAQVPSNVKAAAADPPAAKPQTRPVTPPVENSGSAVAPEEAGSGQQEFNQAREMLRGEHRQRDLWRAVDLLWAGVKKGYVPAEVTLADLYRRGDGVEKNCDQAQVLLVAASKKGSPEARRMLEQMAEVPCQ